MCCVNARSRENGERHQKTIAPRGTMKHIEDNAGSERKPLAGAAKSVPAVAADKPYHRKNLREDLLRSALELTVERDGPAFSLRELAMREKVSHTAVYRHFSDKASLFAELSSEGFRQLALYQNRTIEAPDLPPLARLEQMGATYVRFAMENVGFFRVMFDVNLAGEWEEARKGERTAFGNLVGLVRQCQSEGDIIDADPRAIATYLVLSPHGLAHFNNIGHLTHLLQTSMTLDQLATQVFRLTLAPFLTKPYSEQDVRALVNSIF
ncbi:MULTISPECIES: WHG domain-containing protein [Rhizobium/Agrobacterium group]|uniref:WHG domain-containing protein n=1 Tax=Rhizobium/Agrobacterium group TaxID=227290 RepID=UPI0018D4AED5